MSAYILYVTLLYFSAFTVSQSFDFNVDNHHDFKGFYNHTLYETNNRLLNLANKISNHLNPVMNVSHIINNVTKMYTAELDKLFKVMSEHKVRYDLEKQLIFLYIVQANNEIFLANCQTLHENIVAFMNKQVWAKDKENLIKLIQKEGVEDKKSSLMYICYILNVCRSYPAVSDHVNELLGNILELPNFRLVLVAKQTADIIRAKANTGHFGKIINDYVASQIGMNFERLVEDPEELRRVISVSRHIIRNKLKLFKTKHGIVKKRTKALRLLIDIFDKAFDGLGNEAINIEFSNVISDLKDWTIGNVKDVKRPLKEFFSYMIDKLQFEWQEDAAAEVRVLIEVLEFGTTSENSMVYEDLMYKGSKYLNAGFFVSDIDPI